MSVCSLRNTSDVWNWNTSPKHPSFQLAHQIMLTRNAVSFYCICAVYIILGLGWQKLELSATVISNALLLLLLCVRHYCFANFPFHKFSGAIERHTSFDLGHSWVQWYCSCLDGVAPYLNYNASYDAVYSIIIFVRPYVTK